MEQKKPRTLGFIQPRSYLELVIAGFTVVTLPLLLAFITGVFYVNKLTEQSQEALYRAVQSTQNSRELLDTIASMERSIRQYLVLQDQQLLQAYQNRHDKYVEVSSQLSGLLVDEGMKNRLTSLDSMEADLHDRFVAQSQQGGTSDSVEPMEFIALTELAQTLLRDTNQLIDSEMAILQQMSDQAEEIVFWELSALLPGAIIFIVLFTVLLSRPIRQLAQGIQQIGDGRFEEEIQVSGPSDLTYLGEQLNWLRTRLQYLEDKKSKFLHYVSHELKTPLAAIREGSELMSEEVTGPLTDRQKEVAQILRKNSISLQQMIEKLLSFNMPGQASQASHVERLNMPYIVDTVIADHKPVLMAKHIDLDASVEELHMEGNEEQMRVVLDNLLSNAIKYTPENGQVVLRINQQDEQVQIDVRDSGPGIDTEDADRVFDAFYQGKQSGQGVIRGSGLGLSIVREFVEAHHGRIVLLGNQKEGGAHFRVTLPLTLKEKELAIA